MNLSNIYSSANTKNGIISIYGEKKDPKIINNGDLFIYFLSIYGIGIHCPEINDK